MFKQLSSYIQHLILLIISLALLSACALTPQSAAPTATEKNAEENAEAITEANSGHGILRIPHPVDWGGKESLDPASPVEFKSATVLLYDRLVRLNTDGIPAPELATEWRANDDATEWTFILREGVTFHDGKSFSSADVAYTIAHFLDPNLESPMTATLGLIESTETPDAQTIIIKLTQGHADLPLLLGHRGAAIIPEGSGETIGQTGIGTGPFTMESLDPEGTTHLRANDAYWKGIPEAAEVELLGLPDAAARVLAAQAGQVDLLLDVTAAQAALFANNDDFTVINFPSGRFATLAMRTDTPPFDDVRVRQALRMVVNRQEMVDLVLEGHGTATCDVPVAPNDMYRWNTECPQDIEQAKVLLAEAGYADGIDVTVYVSDLDPQFIPLAEVYQQQAAEAGIRVTIDVKPADSYWSDVWMTQPFVASYWIDRPADQILNELWRSNAAWNESFFQRADFDQILDDARAEIDFEQRRALYHAAQQIIAEEGGHLIPYYINEFYVLHNNVTGIPPRSWLDAEWHLVSKSE